MVNGEWGGAGLRGEVSRGSGVPMLNMRRIEGNLREGGGHLRVAFTYPAHPEETMLTWLCR